MNKIYKTILAASTAFIVAGATIIPASVFAGDAANGRKAYTIDQINADVLGDAITFNSITNGKIGDERNFVGAKVSSSNTSIWKSDSIAVKDGETYTIRLYVHNNNPKGMNAVAENVRANFSLPTTVAKEQTITGYLSASNAMPTKIWDDVKLTSSDDFYIEYIKGSAKYTNSKMGPVSLADGVITSGATLGYSSLNGKIPGCYEYDGQVTIQVKVHTSVTAKLAKTVRIKGTKNWSESVDAKIGDEVEYQIEYQNLSSSKVDRVVIRDILPTNMEYVKGSTILYNSNHEGGLKVKEDTVTTEGLGIGSYEARGNAYVRFTAKVVNKSLACGSNQLVNWASAVVNSDVFKDDASVMVVRDDDSCKKKDEPKKEDPKKEDPKEDPKKEDPKEDPKKEEPKEEPKKEEPKKEEPKKEEPKKEETPVKVVDTGAGEVAGAALGAGAMTTALGYYVASRKKLM